MKCLNHVAVDQMQNLLFQFTRTRDTHSIFYPKILQNVVLIVM